MVELTNPRQTNSLKHICTVICWAAMVVFAAHACTHMVAAGDTWVALACGRHFVNHGVDTVEPFSANSHKPGPTDQQLQKFPQWLRPVIKKAHPTGWVDQNWLTHVMFYLLAKNPGADVNYSYVGLVYWKFTVTFLSVICTYFIARNLGVSRYLSAGAACFAVFTARSFIDIRPAVFSNLMVPLYLLILVLATYRNFRYIWLIVPVIVFWANVHGGYIYAFMMLVPFVALNFITIPFKERFCSIGFKGILHTIGAGAAAFVAMIIFNPFHLTNLTHTFEISISKHAESWRSVNEWHPAFERDNPVGDEEAFLVMFILGWVALSLWVFAGFLKPKVETRRRARQNAETIPGDYQWPKIDLAYIAIAAFTVYMAIESRRFIPIAALAACPVIAMFLEHAVRMFLARKNFDNTSQLSVPDARPVVERSMGAAIGVCVLLAAVFWGAKFKRIYLDPWAVDDVRDSVFMRMTASNVKPFEVMQFIRDNNLKGNMFNHWTEGGAVALGEKLDPKTGQIPLKLFMDGRAQAAYNHDKFILWQYIKSGGPIVRNAQLARRQLTGEDYKKIGEWIDGQMKQYNVWVILMPVNQINDTFMIAMQTTTNWRTAFMDNYQFLMVDKDTPQGETLINNILSEKAVYPDEHTKDLALAKNLVMFQDPNLALRGLAYAKKAFEISHSQAPMQVLVHDAGRRPQLRAEVASYVKEYLDEFIANKDKYATEPGYVKKLVAAMIAADFLYRQGTPDTRQYQGLTDEYMGERNEIGERGRW
jgi:hypothetical protein